MLNLGEHSHSKTFTSITCFCNVIHYFTILQLFCFDTDTRLMITCRFPILEYKDDIQCHFDIFDYTIFPERWEREVLCLLFLSWIKVYKTRHSTYCLSHLDMYIIINISYTPFVFKKFTWNPFKSIVGWWQYWHLAFEQIDLSANDRKLFTIHINIKLLNILKKSRWMKWI